MEIPANATAEVVIPNPTGATVMEGGVAATAADGVATVHHRDGETVISVGSGSYRFTLP